MMGHDRVRVDIDSGMSVVGSRPLRLRLATSLLMIFAMLPALAAPLQGAWRAAKASDNADSVRSAAVDAGDTRFDPAQLTVIPAGAHGAWIRLRRSDADAENAASPAADWVLQVEDPGLQSISLFPAQGPPVLKANLLQPHEGWQGHGRIGFALDRGEADRVASGGSPLLLRMEPGRLVASPVRFSLVSTAEFQREDARWLALATACFAIMAAMAIMALLFALELRDIAFVWYAVYVLGYALVLAIQSGFVAEPLEWSWIAGSPSAWGRAATAISVASASLFLSRFAGLRLYAPRMRIAVLAMGWSTGGLMLLGSIPLPALRFVASILINPLLILGGPIMLAASVVAWWRGSRYAGFFLLGWTPLLVVTVLGSAQIFGTLPTWTWLTDASLVTGAFEALVLSLGLGDRALALKHDRDIAQALADSDALTGVFNRRGLDRCLAALVDHALRQRRPLTLLFLDLDRFKLLNDHQGHAAGDVALIAVTRLMRSDMRAHDVLGRYGGEEFLAALPGCDIEAAQVIAERIRTDLLAMAIAVVSPADALTASIGVAGWEWGDDAQALVDRADRAMYAAKRAGGNRVS
ncbi:MAG TPA: diguanylate cyclase, partial [Xanthomonadaceae bacterium]|nr:diguanylate cyclase [Xanthomonadaceae bacterium]